VIYGVLKRKLDRQAQNWLVIEERKWIADRERSKTDSNFLEMSNNPLRCLDA
jgi:hypothetical protein